eukprot:3851784-Alexandrium_andersonii.AAC.1
MSLFAGSRGAQADAAQAYAQAKLGGAPAWVRLPRHQWPQVRVDAVAVGPVVLLRLARFWPFGFGGAGS